MPTERFYRLPEAKKQVIREAVIKEFARVPFEKASINQIIQNAGISRGSFYTYFEDKQDVLKFILSDGCNQMREQCETILKKSGGDVFSVLEFLYEFMIERIVEVKDRIAFARNVFSSEENIKLFWQASGRPEDREPERNGYPNAWLWERIDRSAIVCEKPEDLDSLMMMGMAVIVSSVQRYYESPNKLDENRNRFRRMLEILKHGVLKQ